MQGRSVRYAVSTAWGRARRRAGTAPGPRHVRCKSALGPAHRDRRQPPARPTARAASMGCRRPGRVACSMRRDARGARPGEAAIRARPLARTWRRAWQPADGGPSLALVSAPRLAPSRQPAACLARLAGRLARPGCFVMQGLASMRLHRPRHRQPLRWLCAAGTIRRQPFPVRARVQRAPDLDRLRPRDDASRRKPIRLRRQGWLPRPSVGVRANQLPAVPISPRPWSGAPWASSRAVRRRLRLWWSTRSFQRLSVRLVGLHDLAPPRGWPRQPSSSPAFRLRPSSPPAHPAHRVYRAHSSSPSGVPPNLSVCLGPPKAPIAPTASTAPTAYFHRLAPVPRPSSRPAREGSSAQPTSPAGVLRSAGMPRPTQASRPASSTQPGSTRWRPVRIRDRPIAADRPAPGRARSSRATRRRLPGRHRPTKPPRARRIPGARHGTAAAGARRSRCRTWSQADCDGRKACSEPRTWPVSSMKPAPCAAGPTQPGSGRWQRIARMRMGPGLAPVYEGCRLSDSNG